MDRIVFQPDSRKESADASKVLRHENRKFEFFGGTISSWSVLIDCDLIDSDIDFREASVFCKANTSSPFVLAGFENK